MRLLQTIAAVLVVSLAGAASAVTTVNIDLEAAGGGTTHVGDDGAISSAGGTVWNGVVSGTDTNDLLDEFGVASTVDIRFSGSGGGTFTDAGINDLQDSGSSASIELFDLDPGMTYTLAIYVGLNGGFSFTHAGGTDFFFFGDPGADGWSLPGTESIPNGTSGDYYLLTGFVPANLGAGDFGFSIGPDGTVTAVQVLVPEPSSFLLVSLGIIGLTAKRRSGRR